MDRGAGQATVQHITKTDMTKQLSIAHSTDPTQGKEKMVDSDLCFQATPGLFPESQCQEDVCSLVLENHQGCAIWKGLLRMDTWEGESQTSWPGPLKSRGHAPFSSRSTKLKSQPQALLS